MSELFKSVELSNGLLVKFYDQSNRYFGDFHRVHILVVAQISVNKDSLPDHLKHLITLPIEVVGFETILGRMAVPTESLLEIRASLVTDFLNSTGSYLADHVFIESLLRMKKIGKKQRGQTAIRLI